MLKNLDSKLSPYDASRNLPFLRLIPVRDKDYCFWLTDLLPDYEGYQTLDSIRFTDIDMVEINIRSICMFLMTNDVIHTLNIYK